MKDFINVEQMKLAYLAAGQIVTTQGSITAGDGGGNRYLIQTAAEFGGTPNEVTDFVTANTNVAALQVVGAITPERTIPDGDTAPTVLNGEQFVTANTSAITITEFKPVPGAKVIRILFNDANTTIESNTVIKLTGAANFVGAVGDVLTLMYSLTTSAWHEQSRVVA